ncbi:hypothetical protein KKB55_15455, partial [Myxococcota bacterium]|nr:hypothetical protein [Myxococcota bacterium]
AGGAAPVDEDAPPQDARPGPKPGPKVKEEMRKGVLVYGDRAIQLFGAKLSLARAYAKVINGYREVIDPSVRVFSIMVPTAVSYYLPDGHKYKRHSEREYIAEVYKNHANGIISVNTYDEIAKHIDEFIYFRSDHHWTGRGAYYAYRAFCEAAQITPVELDDMERKEKKKYIGSLYRYTKASVIRDHPEFVEYFKPKVTHTARYFDWKDQNKSVKTSFIREKSSGYGVFLGADYPMLIAETSNKNGKTALFIKNSYGNPFAIYLLSHFSKVIVVDYRYTTKKMLDVMREHQVTDLIFLNVTLTGGSKFHRRKIEKIRGEGRYHPAE